MIPKKSSFRHKVAEVLYAAGGSMTIRDCAEKLSHTDYRGLQTVFINMKSSGQLIQRGNVYTLSNAVKRYFDSAALQCDDEPGEIVQPRTRNVFATTLNLSRLPNLQRSIKKRPGSGDLIGIPSHYARLV